MNKLIETFKRDAESFEEKFWYLSDTAKEELKPFFYQSTLNLVTKLIEECQVRKKDAEKYPANYLGNPQKSEGHNLGYSSALSDTISQLENFKAFLEKELSTKIELV